MTVNFSDFKTHESNTLNLINALNFCEETNADGLVFDEGTYVFDDEFAKDQPMCVSNHGEIGYRKSAFLLNGFKGFTVDGGGSRFIFKGIMNAFTVTDCQNVTLKNLTVSFPDYPYPNGFVSNIGENFFDMRFDSQNVVLENNILYVQSGNFKDKVHCDVRFDRHTRAIVHGTGDNSLGRSLNALEKQLLAGGDIRFFDPPIMPSVTDVFGLLTGFRRASGILLDQSENTSIENVTIHSCIGIGVMAQNCHNIEIDGLKVTPDTGRYVSSAADATHFVCCTGLVEVKNSLFEHMLDDALNVHGIYTKITGSNKGKAIVKFMNASSVGIDIYKKGDKVAVVDPDSLKPLEFATVKSAQLLNREYIRLEFEEDIALKCGNLLDNLTRYPELIFENNRVQNNRARGMLIATNKKATVKNCRFHTSGSAIVLECDGRFWFESGAVHDLTVESNVFDHCRYADWDKGVISIPKGKTIIDDFYYHGKVQIINNEFIGHLDDDVYADNVSELIYKGNTSDSPTLRLCHVRKSKLQSNATIVK